MNWNIAGGFYLQPGIYFTTRGAKKKNESVSVTSSYKFSEKCNMNYLQIPILASYRIPINRTVQLDVHAGPYIVIGLSGKYEVEKSLVYTDFNGVGVTESYSEKYDIFEKSTDDGIAGDFNRFDFGLRLGMGVDIRRFYVGWAYDLGMTTLARTGDTYQWLSGTKIRNARSSYRSGTTSDGH